MSGKWRVAKAPEPNWKGRDAARKRFLRQQSELALREAREIARRKGGPVVGPDSSGHRAVSGG